MKTHKVRPVLVESIETNSQNLPLYTIGECIKQLSDVKIGELQSIQRVMFSFEYFKPMELILISLEDEKIEDGDKYLDDCALIREAVTSDEDYWKRRPVYKKVIARQSQISPEYISKFIEQYNNGCVEDLEIEMGIRSNAALGYKEYVYLEHICDKKYVPIKIDANINQNSYSLGEIEEFEDWEIEIYTKLTNGFVTIVEKEYSYNLLCNMQYYMEYCQANGYVTPQDWLNKFKHYSDRKEPIIYTEGEVLNLLHKLELDKNINLAAWFENNKKK